MEKVPTAPDGTALEPGDSAFVWLDLAGLPIGKVVVHEYDHDWGCFRGTCVPVTQVVGRQGLEQIFEVAFAAGQVVDVLKYPVGQL